MEDELSRQLKEAYEKTARFNKINNMLLDLKAGADTLKTDLDKYEAQLVKENIDVEKLENGNFSSHVYSLFGTLEKHIDKERAEALSALLKRDQASKELRETLSSIESLSNERDSLSGCEAEYARLYGLKRQQLLDERGEEAQQILTLTEGINRANANIKEIREAVAAGYRAAQSIDTVIRSLQNAESMGTLDLMGGGLMVSAIKHGHIDDAARAAGYAQMMLSSFRTELADVQVRADIRIEIGGFASFADIFFDSFIADWLVQSRIRDSLNNANNARNTLLYNIEELKMLDSKECMGAMEMQKKLDALIVNTQQPDNQ